MNKQIANFMIVALTLSLGFMACNKTTDLGQDPSFELIPTMNDEIDLETTEEYESKLIATVQKNGHEITFSTTGAPGEAQGIFMEESLYGRTSADQRTILGSMEDDVTPFDVFVKMTDAETVVPKIIATSANEDQLNSSQRVVKEMTRPLELLDANYVETETGALRGCKTQYTLYGTFQTTYCNGGNPNYDIIWCRAYATWQLKHHSKNSQWRYFKNTRVWLDGGGCTTLYFYSYTSKGWKLNKSTRPSAGIKYVAHWNPVNAALRLVAVPGPNTAYRMATRFVK